MSIVMRTALSLRPGCKLLYCPSSRSEIYAPLSLEDHRGKHARFVGYVEKLIGVLDVHGHSPGRYIDQETIQVQFGEDPAREYRADLFIVDDPSAVVSTDPVPTATRLGDLPYPIEFYPGDVVVEAGVPEDDVSNVPRPISAVVLEDRDIGDDIPRYMIVESEEAFKARCAQLRSAHESYESTKEVRRRWYFTAQQLTLRSRGLVWALYNDSQELIRGLSTLSSKEGWEFWRQSGVSISVAYEHESFGGRAPGRGLGLSLSLAEKLFESGAADFFIKYSEYYEGIYHAYRLHEQFAEHRPYVRAAMEWEHSTLVA